MSSNILNDFLSSYDFDNHKHSKVIIRLDGLRCISIHDTLYVSKSQVIEAAQTVCDKFQDPIGTYTVNALNVSNDTLIIDLNPRIDYDDPID